MRLAREERLTVYKAIDSVDLTNLSPKSRSEESPS